MTTDYTSVRVPKDLLDEVDRTCTIHGLGYRSRQEFVVDSIRRRLEAIQDGLAVRHRMQDDVIADIEQRGPLFRKR